MNAVAVAAPDGPLREPLLAAGDIAAPLAFACGTVPLACLPQLGMSALPEPRTQRRHRVGDGDVSPTAR